MSVDFDQNLTVLAGENNSGKSTVLDAIRLLTSPIDDRREIYASPTDISRDSEPADLVIHGTYGDLTDAQRGLHISALESPTAESITYSARYTGPSAGRRRGTFSFSAGFKEGFDPEPEARALIRHVYLPALRDAQRALASGNSDRIALILRRLVEPEALESFEGSARTAFEAIEGHDVVKIASRSITGGLNRLTEGVNRQDATLGFVQPSLARLARDLRFRMADAGLPPCDLAESGLGYANLLFMATVLVELESAREADLTLLLVEEPEAHLHPQLQLATLAFLKDKAEQSRLTEAPSGEPAGHIQIVVTTHSPNLAAAVPVRHLVVLRPASKVTFANPEADGEPPPSLGVGEARVVEDAIPASASAVPIRLLGVPERQLAKLDRYLDVTRSALLFSRTAVLVEGMSEGLLLPTLAREVILRTPPDADSAQQRVFQRRRARFDACCIVPIDGVDFEPFIRVLLSEFRGARIADSIIVITDEDPEAPGDRESGLRDLVAELAPPACLSLFVGRPTLEAELYLPGNEIVLKEAFLSCHPNSEKRWETEITQATGTPGTALVELLSVTRTRKGDYAQALCEKLKGGARFAVPLYLRDAIVAIAGA